MPHTAASPVERHARSGMVWIPSRTFRMGSDRHYAEEAPSRDVTVAGFWIDHAPVTNRDFRSFVEATGWVTQAEIAPRAEDYPGADPNLLTASSLVFTPSDGPVDLRNIGNWWRFLPGAQWRHPYGPDSSINGLEDHPVVHVAWADVAAYAEWAGADLPTEAEWELAARGGLDDTEFAWGDEFAPGGQQMANTWQGQFPYENTAEDGWVRTSPIGAYPPNGYGLVDMVGNTWEWTKDWWSSHAAEAPKSCCAASKPIAETEAASIDPNDPARITRKVLKGGSHLCAPSYCRRYRPAARHAQPVDTSTSHVGFRCVLRPPA
ncbi:MAG: formylglycine-generating enzyme family protein [Caulobacteraceae bacterium]|nr:MAG: formylglycine-generating enzyme family protein [Caulobacteraceae bacterium]